MRSVLVICAALAGCRGTEKTDKPAAPPPSNSTRRLMVTYDIDLDKALDDKAQVIRSDLQAGFADEKTSAVVSVSAIEPGALRIVAADIVMRSDIQDRIKKDYADVLEWRTCPGADGPAALCLRIAPAYGEAVKKAALAAAVKTIKARLVAANVADPRVESKGEQIIVEFPGDDEAGLRLRSLVARTGKLDFKTVDDDSAYMKRVFAHVGNAGKAGTATDPRAIEDEIVSDIDQWRPEDGGAVHTDYYLVAHDREQTVNPERARQLGCLPGRPTCLVSGRAVIERYLADLAAADASFHVPDDRQVGYEHITPLPQAKDRRPMWRTYYLERAAAVDGSSIANATGANDPSSGRPLVLLELDRRGAERFGEVTARISGKKLAIVLDGRVISAPVINGAIRGGRASIAMAGDDAKRVEADRDELVEVLRVGALPAPLREASAMLVP